MSQTRDVHFFLSSCAAQHANFASPDEDVVALVVLPLVARATLGLLAAGGADVVSSTFSGSIRSFKKLLYIPSFSGAHISSVSRTFSLIFVVGRLKPRTVPR